MQKKTGNIAVYERQTCLNAITTKGKQETTKTVADGAKTGVLSKITYKKGGDACTSPRKGAYVISEKNTKEKKKNPSKEHFTQQRGQNLLSVHAP